MGAANRAARGGREPTAAEASRLANDPAALEAQRRELKSMLGQISSTVRRTQPSVIATVNKIDRLMEERDMEAHQREQYVI